MKVPEIHTRWWILLCVCFITFLADLYVDEPSVLVQRLTGTAEACRNGTDKCINLGVDQFNLLFSSEAWASALSSVVMGIVIDRYGCRYALWFCAATMVSGSFLFAMAPYASSTSVSYAIMLTAQVLYGFGDGPLDVAMSAISASWFFYDELTLAFSLETISGRLGSAIVFYLIGSLVEIAGLRASLWLGFSMIATAGILTLVLEVVNRRGEKVARLAANEHGSRLLSWEELKVFILKMDWIYGCFILLVFLYYGTIGTFTANGPNFIAQEYGYSESSSSYVVGIIYDISLLAILFGYLTDRYGYRQHWLSASALLLFLAFVLEMFIQSMPAWLLTTLIGLGYTVFGPTIWACVPLIVSPDLVGTALGTLKFFHYAGIGSLTAIASSILNTSNPRRVPWHTLFMMLTITSGLCLFICVLVALLNLKTGRRLTPSQIERRAIAEIGEETHLVVPDTITYGSQTK